MPTILVVEDRPDHRRFIADVLRLDGYDVLTATNGADALDVLRQERVDLALLDHQMAGMNGLECFDKIKALPHPPPVVFITVLGEEEPFIALRKQGVPVLVKPVSRKEISDTVRRALGARAVA